MSEIKLLYCPHYPAIHLVFSPLGRVWREGRYIKIMAKKTQKAKGWPSLIPNCMFTVCKNGGEGLENLVTCDDNR